MKLYKFYTAANYRKAMNAPLAAYWPARKYHHDANTKGGAAAYRARMNGGEAA